MRKESAPSILKDSTSILNDDTNDSINNHNVKLEAADSVGDLRVGNGVSSIALESLAVSSVTDSMRSSNSSLAKSESSDTPLSVLRHPGRATSAQLKKVSICDVASPMGKREQAISPSGGERVLSHRASLIQVSSCRKARKVRFFINGDKFFKGAVIAVNNEKFRTFEKLLEHLTRIMCTQVTLPHGVRTIFSLEGKPVSDIEVIGNGESYVCSSVSSFKKLDYIALGNTKHYS